MLAKFKYFFFLIWLIPFTGFAQTAVIEIKGDVDDLNTGQGLSGVTVSIYKGGSLVETVTTGSGGKYKFKKINADGVLTVKFSKPGFVGKFAEIDPTGIHPEDAGVFPLEVSTSIFEQVPDVDFSILDSKPVAKAKYNKGVDNLEWDLQYIEKIKKDVEKIIAKAEEIKQAQTDAAAATEKKFNDAVTAGNAAASSGDYTTAIKKYNEALAVKDDADIKKKIADAETKKKEAEAKADTDKKYNDLMAEAKKFFDAKDYASAKQKYQDASVVKATEVAPKEKIKEIDAILAKQMEDETKYNKYLADGDKALLNSKYDEAIAQFTEASKMRPTEQQPKDQLKKAQDAKKAAEADALAEKKKKEDFDKFVLTADQNATAKKYDDAIANYDKALALIDDAAVKTKKENAIKAKEAEVAANQKAEEEKEKERIRREEYEKLMKKGGEEMTATEYEKAIGTFESALIIFPKDVPAETKLAEAKKKRDEKLANDKLAEEQKKNKEKFDALLEKGDGEVGKAEYDKAIATFKEALVIIKDEPNAKSKLADAEKRKSEYVKNKADFDKLVSEGDVAATAKKYDDAIGKFEKALALFDDAAVQTKLDKAKSDKDAANAALENEKKKNQEKFDELIAQGDSEMNASTFDKAIVSYTAALAIFKDDAGAKAKLVEAEKKKNEFAKNKANFDKLVSEGDLANNGKKYDDAIAKYEQAIAIIQDATVQSKIDKAKADRDALLNAAEAEKKKKEEFNALLVKGDGEVKSESFDNAIATFEEALKIIPKEASAEAKLADAKKKRDDKLKNDQLAEEQKKKREEFDKLVAQGDDEMSASTFDKAITSYTSALAIIKDDAGAKAKLAEAQKKKTEADLANKSAEEQKRLAEENFKKHYNAGVSFSTGSEFEKAITEFEAALVIKPGNKDAEDALALAKQRLEDFKATKDKAYNDRIAMADKLFNEGNYIEAKGYYVKANAQRPEDAHPKDRIVECDTKIKEAENADALAKEKRKNYDAAIVKADLAFKASKWDDAISQYELALTFLDDAYPKGQIEIANKNKESALSAAEAEKKKKEDFNALLKKGDGEVTLEDYDAAISSFEEALNLIPKEPTAEKKLADAKIKKDLKDKADLANKEKALKQEQFDKLLAQGDDEMNASTFDKAIDSYTAALAIFKDNTIAKAKLLEAQKKKNEADLANKNAEEEKRLAEENFKKHYNAGVSFSTGSEFEKAIKEFEAALVIKPGNKDAEDALALAKQRLEDFKATKDKAYNDRIAMADKLFNEGNYVDAKGYYVKANAQRPEDAHPKNRIKECDDKIAAEGEMKKLRAQFDAAMAKGDTELNSKNYDKAIAFYEAAKIILPNETTPDIKIAEANRLKELAKSENDEAAKKKKFTQLMNEGNAFMTPGEFDAAIAKYEAALVVIPNEPTGEEALALAKKRKKEKEDELDREIQRYLEFADKEFAASNWADALKYYEKYLKYKKNDSYALSQVEKCKAKLKEGETNTTAKAKYDALIKEGNKLFNEKKYNDSRSKFVAALDVYGTMPYPTKKIKEIDDILADLDAKQAIKDKQKQDQALKTQKAKGFDYGDKTMMSADDALSLLLASKREDETKKYDEINKKKEQVNNQNKDLEGNSELNRTDNFNSIGLQKDNMQDYSSNNDFLNNNTDLYRKKKEQFEKETRILNSENELSKSNKDEIKSLHEEFDMNRFEEKLRFINSKEINQEKDEMVTIYKNIDSKAAATRNENGVELVKLKDLTNDQFSANGVKQIEENSREIQGDFDKLNNFNQDVNEKASNVRDKNHELLKIEQENFAKQNITNQEKMLAVNNENVKNEYLNQHNTNQEIYKQAEIIRTENNKDMNQRKDDFANRNKNISDELLKDNAASVKYKHDQTNLINQELNGLAAETRNKNGEELKITHDAFANQQKTNQEIILDKNSTEVKSEFDNQKLQNNLIDAKAADTRNKNGVDLVAKKDLFANSTNKISDELLTKNGEEVKSEFDLLNDQNDKLDETAANVRNENGAELTKQQDNLKTMYTKGAESQADKIRKLKEQQDELARQQKINDAKASKNRWNNGQTINEQKDQDMVFEKGEEGYMSSYTKDYPQGVTEEVYTRKNADGDVSEVTVRRIVVKGNHGNEYRKVVSKSGTYYFKNGKTITNQVWDMEAAK